MKVVVAEALGMCFGVRDALSAISKVANPPATTIYGELVHNPVVLHQLAAQGFQQATEQNRNELPATFDVLVTAHGISDHQRNRLLVAGKRLIDTTCPLVRRVHEATKRLESDGFHLLILGKPGHVEVQGVIEDLRSFDVVANVDQVRTYSQSQLGIVCQTTMPPRLAETMVSRIRSLNPQAEIRFIDTICEPTRRRQQAMMALIAQVQAVIVVGGKNSNNTLELVELCRRHRMPALHVAGAADLEAHWLAAFETVGLTAGTSTLDSTIVEVYQALTNCRLPCPVDSESMTCPPAF